jgi:hypothetical protein
MSLIRLSGEESLNSVRRRSRQLQDLFGLERLSCHRQQHVALPRACMAGFRAVLQQRQVRAEVTPMPTITGGCLCGKIRYSADAEPAFVGLCHCHDCQKFTGSAFAAVIGLPKWAVTVTGALKGFTKRGDSGKPIKRLFCPECGASVMDEAEAAPLVMIAAGTLDDTSWVKPTTQIYCASAQPSVLLSGEMKSFDRMPS